MNRNNQPSKEDRILGWIFVVVILLCLYFFAEFTGVADWIRELLKHGIKQIF